MPDKIVNHFVLADGSTAKYSAEHLAGFIPELLKEATLPTPEGAWIRHHNGEYVTSSATYLFRITGNLPSYIKAFLTSDTASLCAIAFYNSETIGTDSYMKNDSVDFATGVHNDGLWYETSVPDGCKTVAIVTKKPSDTVADYSILFDVGYAVDADINGIENNIVRNETNTKTLILERTLNSSYGTYTSLDRGLYKIDCTFANSDSDVIFAFYLSDTSIVTYRYQIKNDNPSKYVFVPSATFYYEFFCSSYVGNTVKLYKVNTSDSLADTLQAVPVKAGALPSVTVTNGTWAEGGKAPYNSRLAYGLYRYSGLFTVSLSDYSTYKYAVITYRADGTTRVYDCGWKSTDYTFYCDNDEVFGVTLSYVGSGSLTPSDVDAIGLTITSDAYIDKTDPIVDNKIKTIENTLASITTDANAIQNNVLRSQQALFTGRFKPCYDHLFVNKTGNNVVIPHESLYHVRISRRLGYNTIEANVAPTSDGVYIVNHLSNGKFGGYFHHVDGTTDISDIALNSVTWAWVEENVRYNSTIEKYRTRPCTLQEFLGECKQQNIIPFLGRAGDSAVVAIANKIMGKDNYIAYGGNRTLSPSAIIYQWNSSLTTKADILAYCDSFGKPFIYGMGNPTAFTDEELADIVGTLHEHGYYIGVSYADYKWYKYQTLGFDFNGTQALANRIDVGNLHNINSIFGFDGFTYTAATETDDVLEFATAGIIRPDITDTTYELCGIDLEVWYNGKIELYPIGDIADAEYTSDGTSPFYMSIPIVNGSPKFQIIVKPNTTVYDIKYKASVF